MTKSLNEMDGWMNGYIDMEKGTEKKDRRRIKKSHVNFSFGDVCVCGDSILFVNCFNFFVVVDKNDDDENDFFSI